MKRKKIVAGNWKMNLSYPESETLTKGILAEVSQWTNDQCEVMLFPPALYVTSVAHQCVSVPHVYVGGQNMHTQTQGAYTGEISAMMLASIGADAVLVGHSERRMLFHETNDFLAQKVNAALQHNLTPVYCIGETLTERESEKTFHVLEQQLQEGLYHLSETQLANTIIAYEPVWAIGTGKTATPEQAQEVHAFIRKSIQKQYQNADLAQNIILLYGGSVKPDNAEALFNQPDIDGGLIGGASLKAEDFMALVRAACQIAQKG